MIQFIEGNVLVPIVMRNTIRLSSFLVIASLLVGGAVAGFVGAFLAVPMVAAVEVILERFQAREVPVTQAPGTIETEEDSPDQPDHPEGTAALDRPGDSSEPIAARVRSRETRDSPRHEANRVLATRPQCGRCSPAWACAHRRGTVIRDNQP